MKRVIIFIPEFGGIRCERAFEKSYDDAFNYFLTVYGNDYTLLEERCEIGPHLEANRNYCVGLAIENGFDITIWLDGDLILPMDIFTRLICRENPLVAGIYYAKRGKYPICFKRGVFDEGIKHWTYDSIIDYPNTDFECDYPGEGCFRCDVSVLKKIKPPYFEWSYRSSLESQKGVDFLVRHGVRNGSEGRVFFEKIRDMGYKIIVDPKIQCEHITKIGVGRKEFEEKFR